MFEVGTAHAVMAGMRTPYLWILLVTSLLAAGCEVGTDTCRAYSSDGASSGESCEVERCRDSLRCVEGVCVSTGRWTEPCSRSGECDEGLVCSDDVCRGPRAIPEGERCEWADYEPCVEGTYCEPDPGFGVSGTCQPVADRAAACTEDEGCAGALVCVDEVCGDLPTGGERCSERYQCADGFFCHDALRCEPLPVGLGDPCHYEWGLCPAGHICVSGYCEARRGEGEPCSTGGDSCLEDLYCHRDTNTCASALPEGSPCVRNDRCVGDFVCQLIDPATGERRCAEGLGVGEHCGDGQVCGPGSHCDERRRVELPDDD